MNDAETDPTPRLLIVRLGAMGDVIHSMYAVAALRQSLPNARIGWLVEERWSELLCASGSAISGPLTPAKPLVDTVHTVNTKAWRKAMLSGGTWRQISAVWREVRDKNYDVAIDLQGAVKSAMLARLSRTESVIGMQRTREAPAKWFYSRKVPIEGSHVIDHYCSVTRAVAEQHGATIADSVSLPTFPKDKAAELWAEQKVAGAERVILMNPGAGWTAKQWPPARYGEVARALAGEGCIVLVNFGPSEQEIAETIASTSSGTAQPVSCSISQLIALTRRCHLFIGGDTGPLHLAAALQVPVVAIFGPTDPARNGPYGTKSIVLRHPESKTSLSHTAEPDPGLQKITSAEVLGAARKLLGSANG